MNNPQAQPNNREIIIAHFTAQDVKAIKANIAELSESGRIGNADSIAQRFDAAILRAQAPIEPQP